MENNIETYIPLFQTVRAASRDLLRLSVERINEVLLAVSDAIEAETDVLLEANRLDLELMPQDDPKYDRLKLTSQRLAAIAADMRNVAALPSPLGKVLQERTLPNGLHLQRVAVPFGVIGVIYEARPNVSFDVFALCLKAGSACVLKGSKDAENSNRAIVVLIKSVLERKQVNPDVVTLLPATREATTALLHAHGWVDLIIPRGSSNLINYVRSEATVPVIETGAGVCHTYVDASADMACACRIVENAKTRRVSVCNALDCLLLHRDALNRLPEICAPLAAHQVVIYADEVAFATLEQTYPAPLLQRQPDGAYGTEYLDYKMSVHVVANVEEAVAHIQQYGSGHSECIVSRDESAIALFQCLVDAACVYVNAPTSFTDGAQFGLGAEIGISTQKLHARGPMALDEITTYKWLIRGEGQVRA